MTRLLPQLAARGWIRSARVRAAVMLLAASMLLTACEGGSGQSGTAFVFLTVDGFSLGGGPVATIPSSTSQITTTTACVTLRNNLKNPTITTASPLDNVIIQSYTLTVNGLTFTFGTSAIVPAGTVAANVVSGNTATLAVIVVPAGAKGAARTLTTAELRFRGRDGRGQSVEAEGGVTILFDAGDEPTLSCAGAAPVTPPVTPPPTTTP